MMQNIFPTNEIFTNFLSKLFFSSNKKLDKSFIVFPRVMTLAFLKHCDAMSDVIYCSLLYPKILDPGNAQWAKI